jgi:hypothetical protein
MSKMTPKEAVAAERAGADGLLLLPPAGSRSHPEIVR